MNDSQNNKVNRNFLFVVNKKSGTKENDVEKMINTYFSDKAYSTCYFYYPKFENAIQEIQMMVSINKIDTVVAVGGDGTVNLVAKAIIGHHVKMGIIPTGSANGLAKNLNIPDAPKSALDILFGNKIMSCSSISINGNFCIHLGDIGFNAKLIKEFDFKGKRGNLGYIIAAFKTLFSYKHFKMEMLINNETHIEEAAMVVFANANKYGNGLVINPEGSIEDDKFEIILIKQISFREIIKMISSSWRPHYKKTKIFQCRKAKLKLNEPTHFQIDGEYFGKVQTLDLHINKSKVDFYCN